MHGETGTKLGVCHLILYTAQRKIYYKVSWSFD